MAGVAHSELAAVAGDGTPSAVAAGGAGTPPAAGDDCTPDAAAVDTAAVADAAAGIAWVAGRDVAGAAAVAVGLASPGAPFNTLKIVTKIFTKISQNPNENLPVQTSNL